ncbi:hypothetical protein Dimus_000693, partial [Dionaea muscipula]
AAWARLGSFSVMQAERGSVATGWWLLSFWWWCVRWMMRGKAVISVSAAMGGGAGMVGVDDGKGWRWCSSSPRRWSACGVWSSLPARVAAGVVEDELVMMA